MKLIKTILTSKNTGERLSSVESPALSVVRKSENEIKVRPGQTYQQMLGFGGAFTEAAAVSLSKISSSLRTEAIKAYFDPEEGLGYNLGRVHINSCDFSFGNYTYSDDGDNSLESFKIDHDKKLIIPLVDDASHQAGSGLKLLASPWSPPAWMKSNGKMVGGGRLLDEYRKTWADYFVRFINAYKEAGHDIWGITVQNEPAAVQLWESCLFSGEEERDFIKKYLGPKFIEAGLADVKILIWDHNRDLMIERAKAVLSDPEAAKFVWGTGFHWYGCEDFGNVGRVHELYPEKHLLFTEGCVEGGVKPGDWTTGERYGRNMIGDFNNWCEGYIDWNIVLDGTGGPNHVGNLCDAPIIADASKDSLYYNSSYYYIGHFSKFVQSGAYRIFTSNDLDYIHSTAFRNPDGSLAVIVMNEGGSVRNVSIDIEGQFLNLPLINRSIYTFVCG